MGSKTAECQNDSQKRETHLTNRKMQEKGLAYEFKKHNIYMFECPKQECKSKMFLHMPNCGKCNLPNIYYEKDLIVSKQ